MSEQNAITGEFEKSGPFDLPGTPANNPGREPLPAELCTFEHFCRIMHNEAGIIENIQCDAFVNEEHDGTHLQIADFHEQMTIARSLRIAANYMEGNSGS